MQALGTSSMDFLVVCTIGEVYPPLSVVSSYCASSLWNSARSKKPLRMPAIYVLSRNGPILATQGLDRALLL